VKTLRSLVFVSLALLLPAAAIAQESPFKFEFHGFVTGSLYYQDQIFANAQGQGLLLAAPPPTIETGSAAVPDDGHIISGDIRNTRFSFGVTGPATMGATPRGYIELDFFGPYGGGNFGTEQQLPRLRVAIAELKFGGGTLLQVGQQNQLVVPQIPASIVHIANPVTYGAGTIGWRTPGVRVVHSLPLGASKLELAAELVKNKWADAAVGTPASPQNTPGSISLGEAGMPMVQGRLKLDGKAGNVGYSAYLVGVWHQVDLDGFGGSVTPATDDGTLDGYVVEVGGRLNIAMLTVMANFYTGQATGNMLGTIAQFGDIADMGAWANVGVNLSKEFSIWGVYGMARPDEDDVVAAGGTRTANDLYGAMVRYAKGGYQLGVEWYQNKTTWVTGPGTDTDTTANQVIASAGYFF
jgi:hypothetical protein